MRRRWRDIGFSAQMTKEFPPRRLTRPLARLEARWLVHGLPFAAYVLYALQVFHLKAGGEKIFNPFTAQLLAAGILTADNTN